MAFIRVLQLWFVLAAFATRIIVCQREIGITGPAERALELSQDPSLLELAARTGESVQITIISPTVTAIVQEGVNANIWCLPLLDMLPEGTIQWSRLTIDSLTGEVKSGATPTDLNPGDNRIMIGGEDNEWLNITRTLVATGAELADSAVYMCEVCTDRGAVNESCIESNVTLFIIGAPPIIDAADNNTVFEDPPSEVKVGADFCIPPNSNRSYTLLCDLNDAPEDIDGDGTIDIPRAFPNPSRAWLFNNDLIYQALINEGRPDIRDTDPTFFMDPPERMLLFPGVVSPNALSTVGEGGISINLEARNITNPDMLPSSVTAENFRMVLLEQVVGEWTCEANNTFGNDTATTTITICDDDECELGTDNCSQFAMCTNNIGSFTCDCLPGFVGDGVTCNATQCPNLTVPVNGMVSYDMGPATTNNFDIGTVAMYECNDGFTLVGVESRNCTEGDGNSTVGTWTGEDPTCQPIMCPALNSLANGTIVYTNDTVADFDFGTMASHTCLPGFSLVGNEIRICEDDDQADTVGVWSGTAPSCQPTFCPELSDLENGMIMYAADTIPDFDFETVATHTCLPGFTLVGNVIRTCQDDGIWSGNVPTCEPIQCPPLEGLTNGMITYADGTVANYNLGTVATHSCNDGFSLVGNVARICQDEADPVGVWSGTAPSCESIQCPPLEGLTNGMITYADDTVANYNLGTVATHSCNDGFSLVGNVARICQDEADPVGVWSGTAPSCEPIQCPPLEGLTNGMITYADDTVANYNLGTVATHSCNDGFSLVGDETRICQDVYQADNDGVWSGTAPSCEPTDVNECELGTDNYSWYAKCTNTIGSFTCTCKPGFKGNGVTCKDKDECKDGTNKCSKHARCYNYGGFYFCRCKYGYKGNGYSCKPKKRPAVTEAIATMAPVECDDETSRSTRKHRGRRSPGRRSHSRSSSSSSSESSSSSSESSSKPNKCDSTKTSKSTRSKSSRSYSSRSYSSRSYSSRSHSSRSHSSRRRHTRRRG